MTVETSGAARITPTQDKLLRSAARALRDVAKAALVVKSSLSTPYTDAPTDTPWTRFLEAPARRAYNLSAAIRVAQRLADSSGPQPRPSAPVLSHEDLLARVAALPMLDVPTAWAIQRAGVTHQARCSATDGSNGGIGGPWFLCDCGWLEARWRQLRREAEGTG